MSKKKNPDQGDGPDKTQDSGFDLAAPTSGVSRAGQPVIPDPESPAEKAKAVDPRLVADSRSRADWKGLGEDDEDYEDDEDESLDSGAADFFRN